MKALKNPYFIFFLLLLALGSFSCQQESIVPQNNFAITSAEDIGSESPQLPESSAGPVILADEINMLSCGQPIFKKSKSAVLLRQVEVVLNANTANFYGTLYYKFYLSNGSLAYSFSSAASAPKFWLSSGKDYSLIICDASNCQTSTSPTYDIFVPDCGPNQN